MFGYVIVNKDELKIKDFDTYQSFYCGLCQTLRKRYGRVGQSTLNFDMTYLAILLSGLYEPKEEHRDYRCGFHPIHKKNITESQLIEYAADMTIILSYLKCDDDWQDDKRLSKLAYKKLLSSGFDRVSKQYPEKIEAILDAMKRLSALEQAHCEDLDKVSSLFGIVMAEILSYRDDEWRTTLYRMGDYLGRFIYILDAYDDVEDDIKKGEYNPFTKEFQKETFEERSHMILELMIAEAAKEFETLPIIEYLDILRNIVYSGIWSKYEITRKKRSGEENGSV